MEELATKIESSLKDCLGWKGDEPLWRMEEPGPTDIQPPRSKTPRTGRRDTSTERAHQGEGSHQKALATAATLEEEIEWLNWSVTRGQLEAHTHSRSLDCHRQRSWGLNERCHWVWPEESPTPFLECSPPWRGPESEEDEEDLLDFDLETLPELGQRLNFSSRSQLVAQRKRIGRGPPQNPLWRIWRVG